MAKLLTVEMPFAIRGIKHKARKLRWHWATTHVPVEIAEVDKVDDPEALVVCYERRDRDNWKKKETVRKTTAGLAGALWRPLTGRNGPAKFEDLETVGRDGQWRDYPFAKWARCRDAEEMPTYENLLMQMREIADDRLAATQVRAQRIAADVALVDGVIWRKDIEPVWLVRRNGNVVEVDYAKPFPGKVTVGLAFRMDQREKADLAAAAMAEAVGGKVKTSGMRVERAQSEFLSRNTLETTASLLRMSASALKYSLERECRFQRMGAPNELGPLMLEFASATGPGGSWLRAAEIVDRLREFQADQIGDYDREQSGRADVGSFVETVELAMRTGYLPPEVGGVIGPESLDDEEDEAIAAMASI